MKVLFAGTPAFAAKALDALLARGHAIVGVLTQPDRPAGRKLLPQPSAVKVLALHNNIEVLQPSSLKDAQIQSVLRKRVPDVMVVAAYGLILPKEVLDIARFGAINIHASLLPRWRGAAPIQRALLAGDNQTGITIMQMDAGLDTGPMLLREPIPITDELDAGQLHDLLAALGARMICDALEKLALGQLPATPQPLEGATYARKIEKSEARIQWNQSAIEVACKIRAFSPSPGATTMCRGQDIKLLRARVVESESRISEDKKEPGTILQVDTDFIRVACGQGLIDLLVLQRAGARRMAAAEFLRGCQLVQGDCFHT